MPNINLLDIRKTGVTTIEIDSTQTDRTSDARLSEDRIIIGFSRVGPFNTITRIENTEQRNQIYGPIDTFLEKRGSYFHRFIDIALQQGPVLCLNLLPLDNSSDGDKVEYQSYSISPQKTNPDKIKELYAAFYSKERFWKASEDNFISIIDSNITTQDSLLSMVNLSQNKYSVLIRKSNNVSDFNITAQEYFGKDDVPLFLNPLDNLKDFFVDVVVLKGDLTNYKELATDPIYGKYFNSDGLKTTAFNSLESSQDFEVVLSVTGSIIPDLLDGSGISYSIDTVINSYLSKVGMFCTINDDHLNSFTEQKFSEFDMIGHSLVDPDLNITSLDFLSYKFNLLENLLYTQKEDFTLSNVALSDNTDQYQNSVGSGDNGLFSNKVTIDGTAVQANLTPSISLLKMGNGDKYATLKNYITSSGNTIITYTHPDKASEGNFTYQLKSANSTSNVITLKGVHNDLSYDMDGESIYITNGTSKFYYEIASHSVDVANNETDITVTESTNLDRLNTNYKVTWGAAYKIVSANNSANTVTFKGNWDLANVNLTGNVLYLKNNATKTGNVTFSSYSVDSNNNTVLNVSGANVRVANGSTYDILSLGQLKDVVNDVYYVGFGADSITRPKLTSNAVSFAYTPDVVKEKSNSLIGYKSSQLFKDYNDGVVTSGDVYYKEVVVDSSPVVKKYFVGIQELKDNDNIDLIQLDIYTDSNLSETDNEALNFGNKKRVNNEYESVASSDVSLSSKLGNINERILIESTFENGSRIRVTSTEGDKIKIGDYVNSYVIVDGETKYYLSPVLTKKKVTVSGTIYYDLTIARSAKIIIDSTKYYIEKYQPYDDFVSSYNLHYLSGFKMTDYHIPGNSLNRDSQLEKILSVLDNTNLFDALIDRNIIDYKYIVDTFYSPIKNEMYPKTILSRLARDHSKSLALLNGPSIEAFSNSSSPAPVFTTLENVNKVFDARYIETGGNLNLAPDYLFTLPSEKNGAIRTVVVGPDFTFIKNNGQKIQIPASAIASNLFVRKNRSRSDLFKPAAGTARAIVTDPRVIKVEYFSENDLQYLTAVGYNAFMNKNGFGITLYGNKTAYQSKKSALNNAHVVDMLNTVERMIERILERYIFDNNTARTRFEVETDLRNELFPLKGRAFYNFNVNVINTATDSNQILDGSYGLVEISIFPISAIEHFINVLNIKRTSGIETSGFNI